MTTLYQTRKRKGSRDSFGTRSGPTLQRCRKRLNYIQAIKIVEGWVKPKSKAELIEAWQCLHDTRQAYKRPGLTRATCVELLESGIIKEPSLKPTKEFLTKVYCRH